MQPGFRFVGVSCFAMSDVSNNGGKYGSMQSTLNTGYMPRRCGILSSKTLSPKTLVMLYSPYQSRRNFWLGPTRRSFIKMFGSTFDPALLALLPNQPSRIKAYILLFLLLATLGIHIHGLHVGPSFY